MEVELRHAQKLEAVGLLAAGIAHEINTPVQFVGDSLQFLRGGFQDLLQLLADYRGALATADGSERAAVETRLSEADETADLAYLRDEIPEALDRALDGIHRVAGIVKAMKQFGHPDGRAKCPADLNEALQNTLVVARNEYKYVATVETDLEPMPLVPCHVGDLNQVFLNLIVNAAHAVADVVGRSGETGVIRVRTRDDGEHVVVSVEDTGPGIPVELQNRIFDPFFTTKSVGKGTGQGLAIARSIVVDKHAGSLSFETSDGRGTTFYVRLPKHAGTSRPARRVPAASEEPAA
jgi:signal transduction histidine kinase